MFVVGVTLRRSRCEKATIAGRLSLASPSRLPFVLLNAPVFSGRGVVGRRDHHSGFVGWRRFSP
jgi:hypothetical protein